MKYNFDEIIELIDSGKKIQAGYLLKTEGSAPQIPGSMAIFENGNVVFGTLGGGLMEMEAQKASVIASKEEINIFKKVSFNAEMNDNSGSICGGSALFLIDQYPQKHKQIFHSVINSIGRKKCGNLISIFRRINGSCVEIDKFWVEKDELIPDSLMEIFLDEGIIYEEIPDNRKSIYFELEKDEVFKDNAIIAIFIEPIFPKPSLVIAGAGHIGKALCSLAGFLDFIIIVVDPRSELANKQRFPNANEIIVCPYPDAFNTIKITSDTYIVITTQGHRTDIEVLKNCIHSGAAYIGVIGSKRKSLLMGKKFIDESWCVTEEWSFINAPVGININAKTVNEIAFSIAAELIKVRHDNNLPGKRKNICNIILAAGKSSRMGTQKLLLPYKSSSIIKTIAETSIASDSSATKVVLGSDKEKIQAELQDLNLSFIENADFEKGMLTSVQAGVVSLSSKTDGFVVLLGDQPMVSVGIINRLVAVFRKSNKGIIIPTFEGKRGHPVLISSKYRDEILSLNPEIGLRELLMNNNNDILEVETISENILKDIDTPEDYNVSLKEDF